MVNEENKHIEATDATTLDAPVASPEVRTPVRGDETANAALDRMITTIDAAQEELANLQREELAGRAATADSGKRTSLAVSVVIPVYNEVATIDAIVERVQATGYARELIIVDDASTDGTRDRLLELDRKQNVRVLLHGYNKGKGAAVRTALAYATGDTLLIQDADLEYDPADYGRLLEPIERGEADVVYGSRFLENARQDPSWLHRFGNGALTWLSNRATGLSLTDMETCYKVFRRATLREMVLREKRFGFEPELTAKLARRKCRFREVPISYNSRGYDEGKKIHLRDAVRALYCILRYSWLD